MVKRKILLWLRSYLRLNSVLLFARFVFSYYTPVLYLNLLSDSLLPQKRSLTGPPFAYSLSEIFGFHFALRRNCGRDRLEYFLVAKPGDDAVLVLPGLVS